MIEIIINMICSIKAKWSSRNVFLKPFKLGFEISCNFNTMMLLVAVLIANNGIRIKIIFLAKKSLQKSLFIKYASKFSKTAIDKKIIVFLK
jgi:hypothetical protein